MDGSRELSAIPRGDKFQSGQIGFSPSRSTSIAPALWTVCWCGACNTVCWCGACKAGRAKMSAMDTSEGGASAGEEKKDGPAPPRFEIKKWNAVCSPRPKRCVCRARARVERPTRTHAVCWPSTSDDRCAPAAPRARRRDPTRPLKRAAHRHARAGLHVELGHLRRYLRHLPELPERAIYRVPGEPLAEQRERPEHRLRLLRPRLPPGLHPALAQDAERVPAVQQGVGVREDRAHPGLRVAGDDVVGCSVTAYLLFSVFHECLCFFFLPRASRVSLCVVVTVLGLLGCAPGGEKPRDSLLKTRFGSESAPPAPRSTRTGPLRRTRGVPEQC